MEVQDAITFTSVHDRREVHEERKGIREKGGFLILAGVING